MTRRQRVRGVLAGLVLAAWLAGCERLPSAAPTAGKAAEPAEVAAPPAEAPPAPAPEPAEAAKSAEPPPVQGATLEGLVLNPRDGVRILLPDGWEQIDSDDGSLLQMVRRGLIDGVRVSLTLDYTVDAKVPAGTDLKAIEQDFLGKLPLALADRQFELLGSKRVTVAGYPALAVRGDLESDGRRFRMKQYLILRDDTFWTLGVVGPRDSFDPRVEPEFDAIAATLEL